MSANLQPISSDGGFVTAGNIEVSITSVAVSSPAPRINGFSSVNTTLGGNLGGFNFNANGIAFMPGETTFRSNNDTITLESYDTSNSISRSMRLGDNGGLYLEQTGLIPLNNRTWLTINPNAGNVEIIGSIGVVGSTEGGDLSITGGAAEPSTYNTSPGGNVNITGGPGGSDDGGGGGPGGSVNITAGNSLDPAGHAGNVKINTGGSNNWTFDYTGNLTLPGNSFTVNYANGTQVSIGGSSSFIANGTSNVTIPVADGNVVVQTSDGIPNSTANINSQGGYNTGTYTNLSTTGGSGTGLTVDASSPGSGYIDTVTINTPGSGYTEGDTITMVGGDGLGCTFTIGVSVTNWTFGSNGLTTIPGSISASNPATFQAVETITLAGVGDTYASQVIAGGVVGLVDINVYNLDTDSTAALWRFDGSDGSLTIPGTLTSNNGLEFGSPLGINLLANGITGLEIDSSNVDVYTNNSRRWVFESSGNLTAISGNINANITGNTNGYAIGYRDVPQIAASNTTIALTDAGKHYYSTTAGNFTLTIPNNTTTSFSTGTAISIVVQAAGNILVNAASGVTLYMAGNSTAANRVVGTYGMATIMKVASDTWFINGTGVS